MRILAAKKQRRFFVVLLQLRRGMYCGDIGCLGLGNDAFDKFRHGQLDILFNRRRRDLVWRAQFLNGRYFQRSIIVLLEGE